MIGEWQGYGKFSNRTTYIHKSYSYDLGGMYLVERTLDMFPPDTLSTNFEVHQDFSVFYRDDATGGLKAKGFFIEGFIWSSNVTLSDGGKVIAIETEDVENAPPGMRARITYRQQDPDNFTGLFEIAMPGGDYSVMEELVMERVR